MKGFSEEHERLVAIETALEELTLAICRLHSAPADALGEISEGLQRRAETWRSVGLSAATPAPQQMVAIRISSELEELKETLSQSVRGRLSQTP